MLAVKGVRELARQPPSVCGPIRQKRLQVSRAGGWGGVGGWRVAPVRSGEGLSSASGGRPYNVLPRHGHSPSPLAAGVSWV